MEEYKNWAISSLSISISPSLSLVELGEGERGVYYHESSVCHSPSLSPSLSSSLTSLISVPFSSLLTIQSALSTPFESLLSPSLSSSLFSSPCREDDLLALLLLYEKYHQKDHSKWSRHISLLPQAYHNTINFTEEELEMIQGSNLYNITINWKLQIQSDYHSSLPQVQQILQSINHDWFNFDNYLWALCTIWSRFVTVKKSNGMYRAMVPFFDMLNHSPHSSVGHVYQSETDSLVLVTSQPLSNGSEVSLHYGPLSNTRLMMLYGFCLPLNPFDSVDIYATLTPSLDFEGIDPGYQFKKGLLALWGILPLNQNEKKAFPLGLSLSQPIPTDLIICLRIQTGDWGMWQDDDDDDEDEVNFEDRTPSELTLIAEHLAYEDQTGGSGTAEKLFRIKQKNRIFHELARAKDGPLSLGKEMRVSQTLLQALNDMLHAYPTSMATDQHLLNQMGVAIDSHENIGKNVGDNQPFIFPSERAKNSILMRYSEKRVIDRTIKWIERNMTDLTPCK